MRQITSKRFLTVITVILTALTFTQPAWPQSPSQTAPGRDMNRERAIWQGLEKVASKSVETFKAATEALDSKDYEQAAKLYRQVMEKAPSFDHVYRRLGTSLALSGKTDEGLPYLERGYEMNPSLENTITFAQFLGSIGEEKQSSNINKTRALDGLGPLRQPRESDGRDEQTD